MFATRRRPRTFLATAFLAATLVRGSVTAGEEAALDGGIDGESIRAFVASRVADLSPGELRERARQGGRMRVQGTARLSGRIIAESFHVEAGSDVTIEPGTVIWSLGEIRIDAPIRALPAPARMPALAGGPKKAAKGGLVGANGGNAQDVIFSGVDYSVTQPTQLADGQDGQSVVTVGSSGQGGDGGQGGGIIINCTGTVTISANLIPGRGGKGGDAIVTGHDGLAGGGGESVNAACGGKGGKSGDVRIAAPKVVFTLDPVLIGRAAGRIGLRPGGVGGFAHATGGSGGDANVCFTKGGNGGTAKAIGGAAGESTNALVECSELDQPTFDAHDIASFDESESADGGSAIADGGAGGAALSCVPDGCPSRGRKGGAGGKGGKAQAEGGAGNSGGMIGGGRGVLRTRKQAGAEASPGIGGNATANGGAAGKGSFGEDAQRPGAGGAGGSGGAAISTGGRGGSSRLGKKFDQPLAGGQGPLQGGHGGDATSTSGSGADGGDGGSCCNRSGGKGANGGKGGVAGPSGAVKGLGGFGFVPGVPGNATANLGTKGENGVKGADCPSIVNESVTMTASLAKRLFVGVDSPLVLNFANTGGTAAELKIEICCDGKIFFTFRITVPAAGANPGVFVSNSNLHIDSHHDAHHISIMVNGKSVKVFVVPVI